MERATQAESQAIIYELGILSTGEDTVQALEPMAGGNDAKDPHGIRNGGIKAHSRGVRRIG
jgi:hypothetical protein